MGAGSWLAQAPAIHSRPMESALARRGVVVVSFNYRLGSLGSWPIPVCRKPLRQARPATMVCSISLPHCGGPEQHRAIRRGSRECHDLRRFSGGSSVFYLLVSPLAKGLFSRAISQSGGLAIYFPTQHLREHWYGLMPAEIEGASLGNDISTLRQLSAQELLDRARTRTDLMFGDTGIEYRPIVDGYVIPDDPATLFDQGRFAHVPLLLGTTADEGTVFAMGMPIKTVAAWREYARRRFPADGDTIVGQYPAETDAQLFTAVSRFVTDWWFAGSTRAIARAVAARTQSVFLYSSAASIPLSCQFPM